MLMGLINASATFQELINHILYNHLNDFVMTYLDDILIYSKIWKEHEGHVKEVLWWFQKENLILKLEKCEFYK